MANLAGLLGTMLATGMAGRSSRGRGFAASPFGGPAGMGALGGLGGLGGGLGGGMGGLGGLAAGAAGLGMARHATGGDPRKALGLAALGYLAYKAYQDHQQRNPGAPPAPTRASGQASGQGGGSLGERLGSLLGGGRAEEVSAYPEAQIEDRKALLLIRAMVAAANADGHIDQEERRRILANLDQAGAGAEERRAMEQELARPLSIDQIVAEVDSPETAEQVFLASTLAIEADSGAERSYLQFLAARLNLPEERVEALRGAA
jgi:uncharacterized membrane protein YebE (DUF533 family)